MEKKTGGGVSLLMPNQNKPKPPHPAWRADLRERLKEIGVQAPSIRETLFRNPGERPDWLVELSQRLDCWPCDLLDLSYYEEEG